MYYILLGIALILVYSFVVKIISSVIKSFLIVVGLALIIGSIYILILSTSEPVKILNLYVVDNFQVRKVTK